MYHRITSARSWSLGGEGEKEKKGQMNSESEREFHEKVRMANGGEGTKKGGSEVELFPLDAEEEGGES